MTRSSGVASEASARSEELRGAREAEPPTPDTDLTGEIFEVDVDLDTEDES